MAQRMNAVPRGRTRELRHADGSACGCRVDADDQYVEMCAAHRDEWLKRHVVARETYALRWGLA